MKQIEIIKKQRKLLDEVNFLANSFTQNERKDNGIKTEMNSPSQLNHIFL